MSRRICSLPEALFITCCHAVHIGANFGAPAVDFTDGFVQVNLDLFISGLENLLQPSMCFGRPQGEREEKQHSIGSLAKFIKFKTGDGENLKASQFYFIFISSHCNIIKVAFILSIQIY